MAWPSYVVSGQVALANQYNALIDALATWGGGVDAGGYGIKNLASLTYAPNAVMDASAGGFQFHGAAVISATDNAPLTVQNGSTGVSLQLYTGGGAANPQIHSSTGLLVVCSQDATITRTIVLNAPSGKQESITTASGRLTIPALDVTADITAASISAGSVTLTGNLRVATLAVTGASTLASLAVTGGATVAADLAVTGNVSVGGSLGTTRADGYLYVAPWMRVQQIQATAGLVAISPDFTKSVYLTTDNAGNATLGASAGVSFLGCTVNLQVSGWFRTAGASGLYVYSPDFLRYLQISCANGANPVIGSSSGILSVTAACYFPGGIIASAGTVTFQSGVPLTIYNTANTQYLQLTFASGVVNPTFGSTTGWIDTQANIAGRNAGFAWYNAGNAAYGSTLFNGGHPGLTSSTGTFMCNCNFATNSAGGLLCYSPNLSGAYGSFSIQNGAHPTLFSQTGWMVFPANVMIGSGDTSLMRYAAGNLLISDSSATPCTVSAGNFVAYNANRTTYVYMNGGTNPPAIVTSAGIQLTVQTSLLYVTGAVSATAHQTHGSGDDIEDIYRAFYRSPLLLEESADGDDPLITGLPSPHAPAAVAVNAWTLAPSDDGLHILVKRSADEVVEFVLTWDQAKAVPPPADKAGV